MDSPASECVFPFEEDILNTSHDTIVHTMPSSRERVTLSAPALSEENANDTNDAGPTVNEHQVRPSVPIDGADSWGVGSVVMDQ